MPAFIIRNIEPTLWDRVKAQATKEGRPLRWVLLRLLELYATRGLDALSADPTPRSVPTAGHPDPGARPPGL